MQNQSGKKVKALRSDNGGEYISKEFADFCAEKGTIIYSERENGVKM